MHAVTDVTGFGVLGHALELARGSKLSVVLQADEVPLLHEAAMLAEKGFVTGASHRNWASYGDDVVLPADLPEWKRHLLADPQTSGGLLVSCAAASAPAILQTIKAAGFPCGADHRPHRSRQAVDHGRIGGDRDAKRFSRS